MKNLFKKLLACCLVVCMVLTLCVGAVTVSAEEIAYEGTLAIGEANVEAGATEATVSFTALAEKDGIAAANVKVNLPTGATGISKVELETEDENVEVTFFKDATGDEPVVLPGEPEEDNGEDVLVYEGNVNIIDNVFSYILWVKSYNADVTKVAVNVKITFVGTFNETTTVTADIEACKDSVDLLNLETVPGAINVDAHECVPGEPVIENQVAATCYAEGSYDEVVYCSCGEELSRTAKTIEKIAHTPAEAVVENNKPATCYAEGSYDSVVYCSVEACKAEISRTPVTVEKTEHTPAEAVVENNKDATCYAEGSYDSVVYCSVEACKTEISRTPVTVEKIAHTPAEPVEENRVEAQPGVAGSYDSVVYCSVAECKAEISRTTETIPALPKEAVPDSKLTFMARSAAIQDTLAIGYAVADSAFSKYDHIEVEVTATKYDNNRNITTKVAVLTNEQQSGYIMATYTGISMFELDLNVSAVIKAYDANGNFVAYSSTAYNDSPKSLLVTLYQSKNTNVETKRMITDMFNLGAVAQKFFSKAGSALESATPINEGWSQEYASQGEPVLEAAAAPVWDPNSPLTSANITFTPAINMAVTPTLGYMITDKKRNLDITKFRLEVEYDVVLPVTFAGKRAETYTTFTSYGNMHSAVFDKITLADSNCPVTAKLYYDGKLVLTSVYTMNAGMKEKIDSSSSNANMIALSKALALFGASTRAKFSVVV